MIGSMNSVNPAARNRFVYGVVKLWVVDIFVIPLMSLFGLLLNSAVHLHLILYPPLKLQKGFIRLIYC